MDDSYDKGSSGIVCVVSRQVGSVAGTSVFLSKKIANCGVKTVTGVKDLLMRPLKCIGSARAKKSCASSHESAIKSRNDQETGRRKAAKTLIAALESDLTTAQRDLQKAHGNAEDIHSKLASQLVELKAEKKRLLSDLEQAKCKANEASFREGEVKMRVTALEADLTTAQRQLSEPQKEKTVLSDLAVEKKNELDSTREEVESVPAPTVGQVVEKPSKKAKMPAPAAVTEAEVQAAVFAIATDKIIFARALSEITNPDATVRIDAAKIMAGIRHKLTVKALAAQMACESSAQVRQECIKALASLEMPEALPAIERALTDETGSVRLAAVWGLYHLAGTESASAIIHMFADTDEGVRRRAASCVGWLGQKELAVELLPLLDDNSISVRQTAVEAMGSLRNRKVVSSLIGQLNDPVESIRKAVLSAIETITGKKMSASFPKNHEKFERLTARWRQWHKEQLLG